MSIKMLPHPNVMAALRDFGAYVRELPTASAERKAQIRREGVACDDLMNYSYEVADTGHRAWKLLYNRVGDVLVGSAP